MDRLVLSAKEIGPPSLAARLAVADAVLSFVTDADDQHAVWLY